MSELLPLILAFAAGLLLGLIYFGGLWLTVRRLPTMRRPALLFLTSFVLRTTVTVAGFYFVMGDRWQRAIACLVGFILMRIVLTVRLRPDRLPAVSLREEVLSP